MSINNNLEDRIYILGKGFCKLSGGNFKSDINISFPFIELSLLDQQYEPGQDLTKEENKQFTSFCKTKIIFTNIESIKRFKNQLEEFIESF